MGSCRVGGHIEFLKWALSNSGPLTEPDRESLLVAAAAGGSRDCVGLAFSMLSSISPTLAARALKDANPIGDFKAFLAVEIERQAISQASALGRGSTAPTLKRGSFPHQAQSGHRPWPARDQRAARFCGRGFSGTLAAWAMSHPARMKSQRFSTSA